MALIKFSTPPTLAGLFFALHLLRVQGFYFALLQYSRIQAFTARFVPSMQLYCPRHKTAHRALRGLFLRFAPFYRPQYQTDTNGYNTACTTLELINAPGCPPAHTRYHRHAGRYTAQRRPPIIIRYIRVQGHAPVIDPCQTVQQIADNDSPAGSRYFPRPAAGGLAPGQRSGRACWHLPPGGAVQRQGRGGRRGTIGGSRRSSFRAFAR